MKKKLFTRDFTLVVIGQIISLFGNAILRFALPLYLLRQKNSSTIFGMATAVSFIPMVVLSIIGGILADRVNKRNIMVILDFSTAFLIILLCFTFKEVPIVPLFITVMMILYGISGTYQPAVQASIPLLVDSDNLVAGNAIINQVSTLANLLGPIIGGMLFGMGGLTPILIVSIICFVLSAIMEIFIKIPFIKKEDKKGIFSIAKDDMKEGLEFVKKDKPIFFSVAFVVAVFNLILAAAMIVGIPVLIVQIFKMSDTKLGITQGVSALGGLFGGVLAAIGHKKFKPKNAHRLLGICGLCVGIIGIVLLLKTSNFVFYISITVISFASMVFATMFNIQTITLVQSQTPSHLVGKIMAILFAIVLSAQPIGQAMYGAMFDVFHDMPWVLLISSAFISCLIALYSRKVFSMLTV